MRYIRYNSTARRECDVTRMSWRHLYVITDVTSNALTTVKWRGVDRRDVRTTQRPLADTDPQNILDPRTDSGSSVRENLRTRTDANSTRSDL